MMYSEICCCCSSSNNFSMFIIIITSVLVLSLIIPAHNAQIDPDISYKDCSLYRNISSPAPCGNPIRGRFDYPFWVDNRQPSDCGLEEFKLSCEDSGDLVVDIGPGNKYLVDEINLPKSVLTLRHCDNPLENICASTEISSAILNEKLYNYSHNTEVIHLFHNCHTDTGSTWIHEPNFSCSLGDNSIYFFTDNSLSEAPQALKDELSNCQTTTLPVNKTVLQQFKDDPQKPPEDLFKFEVHYIIEESAACDECLRNSSLCWRGTHSVNNTCLYPKGKDDKTGVIIGVVAGVVGVGMFLLLVSFILYRRRKLKRGSSAVSQNVSSYSFSMSDSEKGGGTYMGVPIFSYNELEKATNNFDPGNELGDGGFGTVYKGKLQDGREVAVKRLYENSFKRVEQFMNEIAILAKLRHPNLVVLYGSTSHECRRLLLVYEYIPNGTIADHLYEEDAKPGNLTWKTRMSIAVETSSALLYLHLSKVIHRDVKTTNILVDDNFHVKVADFGLSRLFPQNFTHVSTAPQGTPGYVDPEYHQCYQLTAKSDVYSFGVVLIELISSKPAVDITRHRHEINLANLAINKIQGDALHELVDPSLGFESDYEIRNMISEVAELAFRCLQNDRESRPSMDEVHVSLKEIQNRYYGKKNELADNVFRDDALLLKNHPPNRSPDSVTVKWVSKSTNDALLLKNHPPNRSPDSVTVEWVSKSTNSSSSR